MLHRLRIILAYTKTLFKMLHSLYRMIHWILSFLQLLMSVMCAFPCDLNIIIFFRINEPPKQLRFSRLINKDYSFPWKLTNRRFIIPIRSINQYLTMIHSWFIISINIHILWSDNYICILSNDHSDTELYNLFDKPSSLSLSLSL